MVDSVVGWGGLRVAGGWWGGMLLYLLGSGHNWQRFRGSAANIGSNLLCGMMCMVRVVDKVTLYKYIYTVWVKIHIIFPTRQHLNVKRAI